MSTAYRDAELLRGEGDAKAAEMDRMLGGGAQWAVESGWGERSDLERVEEGGRMRDARPGKAQPGSAGYAPETTLSDEIEIGAVVAWVMMDELGGRRVK